MSHLEKGIYGHELDDAKIGLFGLKTGQNPTDWALKNAGWYNRRGQELGWGSLAPKDFDKIAEGLEELESNELFIVVPERHSSRQEFHRYDFSREGLDWREPGLDYVAKHCCIIIARSGVFSVDRHGFGFGYNVKDLISPQEASALIFGQQP